MKKSTRSSSRKSSTSKASTRNAKTTVKPVTIDLEATEVSSKSETTPPKEAAKKRSSVPGTKPVSRESRSLNDENQTQFGRRNSSTDKKTTSDTAETEVKMTKPNDSAQSKPKSSKTSGQDNNKETDTEPTLVAPAAANAGSGFGGKLVAGVVGGVIALGGAWFLQTSGILSSTSQDVATNESLSATKTELEASLNALKAQIDQNAAALENKTDTTDVDKRIAASARDVSETLASAAGSDLDEVASQVNETTKRVEDLQAQSRETVTTLTRLSQSVAGNDTAETVTTLKSQLEDALKQIELMSAQMTTLKAGAFDLTNRPEPKPADTPETLAAIESLQSAIPELKQDMTSQIEQLSSAVTTRLDAVEKSSAPVAGLSQDVANLKSGIENLVARTAQGESTIAALRDQSRQIEEKSQLVDQKATRAVAAAALKAQIDRGEPYAETLANLSAVADPATDLTGLAPLAETGVPTTTQLAAQFSGLKKAISEALAPPPADDIASRLLSGARSFIKVESLAPQDGDSPDALVQSISSALSSNNLNDASAAWNKLPEPAKKVSSSWHDGLTARMTANSILSKVVQTLLLDGTSQ